MNRTTYAIYGHPITDDRDYIGTVDDYKQAETLAKRWTEEYWEVVISADTLNDDGTWSSIETSFFMEPAS